MRLPTSRAARAPWGPCGFFSHTHLSPFACSEQHISTDEISVLWRLAKGWGDGGEGGDSARHKAFLFCSRIVSEGVKAPGARRRWEVGSGQYPSSPSARPASCCWPACPARPALALGPPISSHLARLVSILPPQDLREECPPISPGSQDPGPLPVTCGSGRPEAAVGQLKGTSSRRGNLVAQPHGATETQPTQRAQLSGSASHPGQALKPAPHLTGLKSCSSPQAVTS